MEHEAIQQAIQHSNLIKSFAHSHPKSSLITSVLILIGTAIMHATDVVPFFVWGAQITGAILAAWTSIEVRRYYITKRKLLEKELEELKKN